ncbi:phage tail assembly protein [Nguyenibacter vanlangensis]|uniref:Phage tail assembly protein n=1 Tax=Nguyenibacter vanlangensis TaxID=1216886 RepID=A0ABZ3D1R8_9PROT
MAKEDYCTVNPDGSVTVALSKTYTFDGAQREKITLREPTVRDQKLFPAGASQKATADAEGKLFAHLADGVTPAQVDDLTIRDYGRLQDAFGFFLD